MSSEIYSDKLKLSCEICSKKFKSKHTLKEHDKVHSSVVYQCSQCSHETKHKHNLKEHMKNVHENTKVICNYCQKIFSGNSSLNAHKRGYCSSNSKDLSFICNICKDTFNTQLKLNDHNRKIHKERKQHKCDKCGKTLCSLFYLKLHISAKHEDPQYNWVCEVCKKSFSTQKYLRVHKRQHSESFKVTCSICNLELKNKHIRKAHISRVHSNKTKDHVCGACSKDFLTYLELQRHLTVHGTAKNFHCNICDKSFRLKSMLDLHLPKHKNTFDFKCDLCNNAYKYKQTLKRHRRKEHKEQYNWGK